MRLVTYSPTLAGPDQPSVSPRLGWVTEEGIVDVVAAGEGDLPATMESFLIGLDIGGAELVEDMTAALAAGGPPPVPDAVILAPLPRPLSVRDFMAFEKHVRNARARRGLEVPAQWYEIPVFYFSNALAIRGPEDPVWAPPGSEALDFEFEVAVVIGRRGRDIAPEVAFDHVAGLAILNDWSARDLQMREMPVLLGPAKGKDFATSMGPWLTTIDELGDRIEGEHIRLAMSCRLNGSEVTSGNLADLYHTVPRMIAHASRGVELHPGEVLGTGTLGGGCLLENPDAGYLKPGDVVELEVERLGTLRTEVVAPPPPR